MIEIHIKLTIKNPKKTRSKVWRLEDLLNGVWCQSTRIDYLRVGNFIRFLYWLTEILTSF